MNKKIYFYPSCPREGYTNPYCINYKKALCNEFQVLDADNKITKFKTATLLRYSFKADIVVLNWIENVASLRLGLLQFVLACLSLFVIRLRKRKIVWMFHNMIPHEGRNVYSDFMCNYLYKHSTLIISHSKEAAKYAQQYARCKVEYICHPVKTYPFISNHKMGKEYDVLIWGTILPYKGIMEFLENCIYKMQDHKILIIGKCKDDDLKRKIVFMSSRFNNLKFENRFACFEELSELVCKSRYILFPYIGESVSSSGVLIDTIAMGGSPIGPRKGAFKDLSDENVCTCYSNYNELIDIVKNDYAMITSHDRLFFIEENSWENFGDRLYKAINCSSFL